VITEEQVIKLAEEHIAGSDKFIVLVKVKPGNKIAVFIDADSAVLIDDCIKLSRFIESQLDRDKEDFELDVSSAGLDSPLKLERQYRKNNGKQVKVILKTGAVKVGMLAAVTDKGFELTETIKEKKKEVQKVNTAFTFSEVKETRVVINF
jgi:ribosome maturation factor RimP